MAPTAWTVLGRVWNHPGNRGGRVRGILRAVAWQVFKRLVGRPLVVEYCEGFSILCPPDSGCASNVFYGNLYFDPAEMQLLRRVLREGDGFIDGGANIGVYSMLAASLVGRQGKVVAYEPSPEHVRHFEANVALNGFSNVELHPVALAGESGEVPFVTTRDVSNRVQTRSDRDEDTIMVEAVTLDQSAGPLPRFTIGKLDLEGSELDALRGADALLTSRCPVIWIVELNRGLLRKRGHEPGALGDLLMRHGFRIMQMERGELIPATLPRESRNFLAVHRECLETVGARLDERPLVPATRWKWPMVSQRLDAGASRP